MEWLLAHAGEMDATTECVSADSTNATEHSVTDGGVGTGAGAAGAAGAGASIGADAGTDVSATAVGSASTSADVAKSLKCEDW